MHALGFTRLLSALAVLSCATALVTDASASWPMARHDAKRTAASAGASNVTAPVPYWRYYLGGALGSLDLIATDLDKDTKTELVYLSGGRLVVKHGDESVLWQTPPRGYQRLIGIADLDGDGSDDLVLASTDHVIVLSAKGAIEWAEPDGEMGAIGQVRIGDLDGDGKSDVYIQECACCGVNSGKTGFVYSFGAGFAQAKLLYTLPFASCGSDGVTLFDGDGDGKLEVALPTHTALHVLDGASGQVLANGPDIGTYVGAAPCRPVDVDGQPGDELVCVQNLFSAPASGGRRVFVAKYTALPTPAITVLWEHALGELDGGDAAAPPDFVVDLDGDGKREIVVAGMTAAKVWTTYVLDAALGTVLATIPGRSAGTAPLAEAGKSVVLTTDQTTLSAWKFDPQQQPAIQMQWSLADRAPFYEPDRALSRVSSAYQRMVVLDFDGDGLVDLVTRKLSAGAELEVYSGKNGAATLLASHALPSDVDPLAAWIVPPTSLPYPQLAVAQNDGTLAFFNNLLQPASLDHGVMRIGGYLWSFPRAAVIAPLTGGVAAEPIVVPDSRGALLRLDATTASWVDPPKVVWSRTHTWAAAIVPGLDPASPDNSAVACLALQEPVTTPPAYRLRVLAGDGSEVWQKTLEDPPFHDVLPGMINADGVPDLLVQHSTNNVIHTRALEGKTGATLWDATPFTISWGLMPFAVSDWNGDGKSDVVSVMDNVRVLSGADGTQLSTGNAFFAYFMPILANVDQGAAEEVTLQGGYFPARTLKHDLVTPVWTGAEDDRPYPFGALAACADSPVLVEGSYQFPSRLKVTKLAGPSAGTFAMLVLAEGKTYANETAAKAAGAWLGQLGNANVHANLTGAGHPTAVVGSTDGWLYALDPCALTVDFAVELGSAVGEAVFGDTDGDGKDEILVSAADGYVYGLENMSIAMPDFVWDTDPDHGIVDKDVDHIDTVSKLSGKWGAVAGATEYEVAIIKAGGGFVTNPPWHSVGAVTEADVPGLTLQNGAMYSFAVRAIGPNGKSVDAVSNGVQVTLPLVEDAGAGGSGGSAGGSGGSTGSTGSGGGHGGSTGSTSSGGGHGGSTGSTTNSGGSGGHALSGVGGSPQTSSAGENGGCGCRAASSGQGATGTAGLGLLGLLALRRRAASQKPHRA